jgi:hypothetical protein
MARAAPQAGNGVPADPAAIKLTRTGAISSARLLVMAGSAAASAATSAGPASAPWPPARPVSSRVPAGRILAGACRATCSGSRRPASTSRRAASTSNSGSGAQLAHGPVTSTWSIGAGTALKNRPSRPKSVASKAAMLALSSSPARCSRSGSRAVRMMSAPLARASRAVSSPRPELPPMTRSVCPSRSRSQRTGDELIGPTMVSGLGFGGRVVPVRHPGLAPGLRVPRNRPRR